MLIYFLHIKIASVGGIFQGAEAADSPNGALSWGWHAEVEVAWDGHW